MLIKLDDAIAACPFCGTEMKNHGHCFSHPRPATDDCILRHYSFDKQKIAEWNLRALPVSDGWENIESGPEETWCLVWDAYSVGTVVVAAKFYGVWQCRSTDEECRVPTHWRPLPAPPTIE